MVVGLVFGGWDWSLDCMVCGAYVETVFGKGLMRFFEKFMAKTVFGTVSAFGV